MAMDGDAHSIRAGKIRLVDPALGDHLADQAVHQGEIGSGAKIQVDISSLRNSSVARIHTDQRRPVRTDHPVQDS